MILEISFKIQSTEDLRLKRFTLRLLMLGPAVFRAGVLTDESTHNRMKNTFFLPLITMFVKYQNTSLKSSPMPETNIGDVLETNKIFYQAGVARYLWLSCQNTKRRGHSFEKEQV